MRAHSSRRRLLQLCGGAVLAGVAGCLGSDDGDDDDDNDGDGDGGGGGGGQQIAAEPTSFAFEMSTSQEVSDGTTTTSDVTGYVTGTGDSYVKVVEDADGDEVTMEHYHVDGSSYIDTMGTCQPTPGQGIELSPYAGYGSYDNFATTVEELEPDDTTTIDGEEVYVFESDQDDVPDFATGDGIEGSEVEWTSTVYVSASTGQLLESESWTKYEDGRESTSNSRLHSFGEEFTVEPPCE